MGKKQATFPPAAVSTSYATQADSAAAGADADVHRRAIATLAIGVGANSAVFSVIEGVLLKPLPYPHPEELIAVDHAAPGVNLNRVGAAPFLYFTYREDGRTLRDIGLWTSDTVSVTGLAEPEEVMSLDVNYEVLAMLGVQPVLGRSFS